jgi:carnitine-CoA ligase
VATYLPNCPEALWTWFGTHLAGSVYVPVNRGHKGQLLGDLLHRAGARVLVTETSALTELEGLGRNHIEHIVLVDASCVPETAAARTWWTWADAATVGAWQGVVPVPQHLASVMYTSGSTGRSKAVLLAHNMQVRGASHVAASMGLRDDDVWHGWQPHFHMMSQLYVILASMVAGASVSLQPRFSRSSFWRQVHADGGCTLIGGMASVMRMVWSQPDDEHSRSNPARLALVSGPFGDLHEAFESRYGVRIVDCFGMTEAEPVTLPSLTGAAPGRHGRPDGDFDLAILDAEDRPTPVGEVGEIACRPRVPGVIFQGYEGDAERTVETWRNLWFHTGDLGLIDDEGYLHFLDRRKHGIRRLGENISAFELEKLIQEHEHVIEAIVIAVARGDGEHDIKVVVVCEADADLTCEQLHRWCEAKMAKFMVPRYIELRDDLPRLAVGKVDRGALTSVDGIWDATRDGDVKAPRVAS